MDLTNKPLIKTAYSINNDTGILTITFSDEIGTIDTLTIENNKFRAFFDAMAVIAEERTDPFAVRLKPRTLYNVSTEEGMVEFA